MKKTLLTLSLALLTSGIHGQTTPELVDMGTSVLWASENLGTDADHPYGNYYRPGALLPYDPNNSDTESKLTTPFEFDSWGGNPSYDAVTAAYGAGWMTPTKEDFEELQNVCTVNRYSDETLGRTVFEFTSTTTNNTIKFISAGSWYGTDDYTDNAKTTLEVWTSSVSKNSTQGHYFVGYSNMGPWLSPGGDLIQAINIRPVYRAFEIDDISLNKNTLSLVVGNSETLTVSISPEVEGTYEWKSSDSSTATVDADGLVKALKLGTCDITVTHSSNPALSATCTVTVTGREATMAPVSVILGAKQQMTVTVTPALDEAENTFNWTSSDEAVATVDSDGNITGIGAGTCIITATNTVYPSITAQAEVTVVVTRDNVQFVDMGSGVYWATENLGTDADHPYGSYYKPGATEAYSKTTVNGSTKYTGGTHFTEATLQHDEWGGDKKYDAATATLGAGWCTPSKEQFEALFANCTTTIDMNYMLGRMVVKMTSKTTGNTLQFVGAGYWGNGNDHTTGELDRRDVCMLTSSGIKNSADQIYFFEAWVSPGIDDPVDGLKTRPSGTIYAYSLRPVYDPSKAVKAESVTLSTPSLEMNEGETATLSATVVPEDASVTAVRWWSSDESVATVDSEGLVTAVSAGECSVAATAIDGSEATGYCTVTVKGGALATLPTVDLGLSVYWSAQAIGASSPYENGTYYYWGSVINGGDVTKSTQADCPVAWGSEAITGVLPDASDNTKPYDIATYLLGNGWTTPTRAQVDELRNNCTKTKMEENGVKFHRFTSKINGNYIDFPLTGYYFNGNKGMTGNAIYQTSDAPANVTMGTTNAIASNYDNLKMMIPTCVMCPVRPVVDPSALGIEDVVVDNPLDINSAEFDVYDIAGRCVRRGVGYNEARATLTSGVYIFITTDKRHRLKIAF